MAMRTTGAQCGRLTLSYQPISSLSPFANNPRRHSPEQIRRLVQSIQAFGMVMPILIDSSGTVVAGHARLLGAQGAKLKEVPTLLAEHLTEAQLQAYRIADNRLAELSTWDDALLAQELKALSELELDFSLESIGFDMGEIDFRIENLPGAVTGEGPDPADAFSSATGPAVCEPGDL